jgi:hypothetical protein
MTEPLDLEPIKARLVAATPGPWRPDDEFGPRYVATDPYGKGFWNVWICTPGHEGDGGWEREEDADLACHAPADIAALIAEVERLRGVVSVMGHEMTIMVAAASISSGGQFTIPARTTFPKTV